FQGRIFLEDVVEPRGYTIRFEGQGGAAGFAKGAARVRLDEEGAGTLLGYVVDAQVGGRLAQVGSRLIDSAALKLADDFFAAFERALTPATAPTSPQATELPEASSHWKRSIGWIALLALLVAMLALALR